LLALSAAHARTHARTYATHAHPNMWAEGMCTQAERGEGGGEEIGREREGERGRESVTLFVSCVDQRRPILLTLLLSY
jgi:hypothetical protein